MALQIQLFNCNSGLAEHLGAQFVRIVLLIKNLANAAIYQHLAADNAGVGGAEKDRASNADALHGGLDNYILLRVQTPADFMPGARGDTHFRAQTSAFDAMPKPGWRPVIARGEDMPVPHRNGAHLAPEAGGPFAHKPGDLHEVFGPGQAFHDYTA